MDDSMNPQEEWRVEVEIAGDEALSFGERLAAADLDEEARDNLGGQVIVSSDANHVFAYARNEVAARAAEAEIRRIVADVEIEATVALTRWHPIEEDWKDPATPMPSTPDEEAAERARRDAAEIAEEEESGEFDWEVAVHVDSIGDMRDLDKKLRESGLEVHRRWKYLLVGALTESRADELADRIRKIAPADAEVEVIVNPNDLPNPVFVAIGALASRLRGGV
jgi:hypothetical protein